MRSTLLVAWREYSENAKTKGFWLGIFMLPLILFLSAYIPVILEKKSRPVRHFFLLDRSGQFEPAIQRSLDDLHQRESLQALREYALTYASDPRSTNLLQILGQSQSIEAALTEVRPLLNPEAPEFTPPPRFYNRVQPNALPDSIGEEAATILRPYLRGDKRIDAGGRKVVLDSAILIPETLNSSNRLQYWSVNLADKALLNLVKESVGRKLKEEEYQRRGLNVAAFREVENLQVPLEEFNPRKDEGEESVSRAERFLQWAPIGFVYLLWVAIFSISQMLLNNTIEEKSNRLIEVLLSSLTPAQFVLGKLIGIAAVGLTMVASWLASLFGLVLWLGTRPGKGEMAGGLLDLLTGSHLLPAFLVYFFFGYLLYAALILAVGSVCNTLKEAQNYMAVITMVMMVPLLTMMFIPKDPNGTLATVLSWIPLYTPFVMMNRAAAHPPLFDIIGTMVLLVLSTLAALWMAVRVFRMGILRTGQPPRLVEMLRWIAGK